MVVGLLLATSLKGQAPPAPPRPTDLPEPHTPEWGAELTRGVGLADSPLGLGHLRPADGEPNAAGHEWLRTQLLPLYRSPAGPHWGWLANGWLLSTDGSKRPFPAACLLETSYEASSITLSALRDDGWFRLAVDPPCNTGDESFWSHRTLLAFGEHKLTAESWRDFFFRDDTSPLWFRQTEVPHALRAGPGSDTERITWIGSHHSITPLEVQGDWMRIGVFQPANYCVDEEDWRGQSHEGWVRWRDPVKGPWLYIWSRGC